MLYVISCWVCGIQYVGKTRTSLKRRFYGHRSTVNTKKLDTPVGHHFDLPNHSITDMILQGIESLGNRPDTVRASREKMWMRRLCTSPMALTSRKETIYSLILYFRIFLFIFLDLYLYIIRSYCLSCSLFVLYVLSCFLFSFFLVHITFWGTCGLDILYKNLRYWIT